MNPAATTNRTAVVQMGENELAALNARADALSLRDANAWEEAVDWGVPDCTNLRPLEWRFMAAPDFD